MFSQPPTCRFLYWQAAGAGFSKAADEWKVRNSFTGPQTYDPKAEREALDQAVQKKATSILLAVTDPALLKDGIDKAVAAGIPFSRSTRTPPPASGSFSLARTTTRVASLADNVWRRILRAKATSLFSACPPSPICRIVNAATRTLSSARPTSRSRGWSISGAILALLSTPPHKSSAKKRGARL
jgi:hypothetical protein